MPVTLRKATADDQPVIRRLVRTAGLNPLNIHWPNFLIAEDHEQVVGIGQVKPHRDGSRELASIAVIPERQKQGLGSLIIRALLARERGPLFLLCVDGNETFYGRFGFRLVQVHALPPILRNTYRLGRIATLLASLVGSRIRIIAMHRP